VNQFTPIPAHELFRDSDAYRQFMIRYGLMSDDGKIVYRYELPQTVIQKLMCRATEITLIVCPLTMTAFEGTYRDWQGARGLHDEEWGSAAWKRKFAILRAFDAACYLNPDLYAALLPKMTEHEALLMSIHMKTMQQQANGGAE
jgi:hypothetical protein